MRSIPIVLAALACALLPAPAIAQDDGDSLAAMMEALGGGGLKGGKLEKAIVKADAEPLGSKDNPVRASGPMGQRGYLARLRCADGAAPEFERSGNVGTGVFGNIVDLYAVECKDAASPAQVHMDMYHGKHVEARPIPGFTIEAP